MGTREPPGRGDRRDRATAQALASGQCRKPADCGDPRRRGADGDRRGGHDGSIPPHSGPAGSLPPGSVWCRAHSGTGGRVRMLGISKRGDTYLRTLLIHGARSVLTTSKSPPEWASCLAERRPANVAAVALANKTARTIWALLAHDRTYRPNFVSQARLGKTGTEITYHQEEVSRQEVAQGTTKPPVMANRSDRDPPSLNRPKGKKPSGRMRRGSADSIRASRHQPARTGRI